MNGNRCHHVDLLHVPSLVPGFATEPSDFGTSCDRTVFHAQSAGLSSAGHRSRHRRLHTFVSDFWACMGCPAWVQLCCRKLSVARNAARIRTMNVKACLFVWFAHVSMALARRNYNSQKCYRVYLTFLWCFFFSFFSYVRGDNRILCFLARLINHREHADESIRTARFIVFKQYKAARDTVVHMLSCVIYHL